MKSQDHWEHIYRTRRENELSWYRPHLDTSLQLLGQVAPPPNGQVLDVGGGESTLVDDLLDRGYRKLTVLDVSSTALEVTRQRLGDRASAVQWLVGDVTRHCFRQHAYDVWHDRAVFHFLTDPRQRSAYVAQVRHAVKPGGYVIVATFAPAAQPRCSGLDVVRYDADALVAAFGAGFGRVASLDEVHRTPGGVLQPFVYCCCKLLAAERINTDVEITESN